MLDELHVRNLGLIAEATIEPGPGLVVVTGETGTGKTLLLGALRLLGGEPARRDLVGPAAREALVEGRFLLGTEEVTLTRRIGQERSRAYRDGAMVPVKALAATTGELVEIVGQHDHLRLLDRAGVLALVDGALDDEGRAARVRYAEAWEHLVAVRARAALLGGDRRALERELDVLRFQIAEIDAAGFSPGDDEELTTRADRLRNAEALAAHLDATAAALGDEGAALGLEAAAKELAAAARLDPSLGALVERLDVVAELLAEVVADLGRIRLDLDHEPAALAEVEERIARLGDLRRKYGDTLDEILAFADEARVRADELTGLLDEADRIGDDLAEAEAEVAAAGADLHEARRRAAARIAADAVAHLRDLGFRAPVLVFDVAEASPGPGGMDRVELLFASDESLAPGPIARVASGGELSRIVLALRLAAGIRDATVLAFDEVDAGIGGATALALGEKLAALAEDRQVLCVTHLPQVAAFADRHFVVRRRDRVATVEEVRGDERVVELSRMLSGLPESDKGRDHAAELLARARRS
ncbi:MAG TPA: DNA repair protein RecN [Actinobacteria bacterium]|nr:DNA repair protein RecN [Actinomycetota bacterium]